MSKDCLPLSYHFSAFLEEAGLLVSGGSYLRSAGSIFPAGPALAESVNEVINSTPPSFHSPAVSTNTDDTLTLLWTREQSLERNVSPFYM